MFVQIFTKAYRKKKNAANTTVPSENARGPLTVC